MRTLRTITALLLSLAPPGLAAQVTVASPAEQRLRVTTASEEAATHFWAGLADGRNIFFSRAAGHMDQAIGLDPNLGLARVFSAWYKPGLTMDERKEAVDRAVAGLTGTTTGEQVTALAIREFVAGNNEQSRVLFGAAVKLMPSDPNVAFYHAFTQPAAEQTAAFRGITQRFPDDAPSYNILAYQLWQQGDRAGGMAAVQRYVQLSPDQPNAHDSYAELLQWEGRFSDALTHYARAVQLDSSFAEAYVGAAEVLQLTGRGAEARAQLQRAIARAPAPITATSYRRAVGHSFLLNGMVPDGMAALAAAAREAQDQNRKTVAAQIHRDMAVAEAMLGRGNAVTASITTHLAAAAQLADTAAPMQLGAMAVAHGLAGDVATARRAAQQLGTRAQGDSALAPMSRIANAVLFLRDNKAQEAIKELSAAPPDDRWVRALLGEAYRATGRLADARALRDGVVNDRDFTLPNSYETMARIYAARVKI